MITFEHITKRYPDGTVAVESRPGEGAAFTVCLPLAPPEDTTTRAA